jgi:hypothetical protein
MPHPYVLTDDTLVVFVGNETFTAPRDHVRFAVKREAHRVLVPKSVDLSLQSVEETRTSQVLLCERDSSPVSDRIWLTLTSLPLKGLSGVVGTGLGNQRVKLVSLDGRDVGVQVLGDIKFLIRRQIPLTCRGRPRSSSSGHHKNRGVDPVILQDSGEYAHLPDLTDVPAVLVQDGLGFRLGDPEEILRDLRELETNIVQSVELGKRVRLVTRT